MNRDESVCRYYAKVMEVTESMHEVSAMLESSLLFDMIMTESGCFEQETIGDKYGG